MPNYRGNNQDNMRHSNGRGYSQSPSPMQAQRPAYPQPEPCCTHKDDILDGMPIAMAYVPWQTWKCLYEAEKGFQRGTIFEELDKPFRGIGGCCK